LDQDKCIRTGCKTNKNRKKSLTAHRRIKQQGLKNFIKIASTEAVRCIQRDVLETKPK
jgi:hypothetical protein